MLRWLLIGGGLTLLFMAASAIAVYFYGKFARTALGPPSQALPTRPGDAADSTLLDRSCSAALADYPGQSGLLLIDHNADAFAARADLARAAQRSLDLLYYIWTDELTAQLLLQEVLAAADRGVRVRLLLDDVGVNNLDRNMRALVTHPQIEVRLFNPTRNRPGGWRRGVEMALRAVSVTRRMHNKAWIADGRVAVTGGRNIGDAYFDANDRANFRDLDLMSIGAVTEQVQTMFDSYWNSPHVLPIDRLRRAPPDPKRLAQKRAGLRALAQSPAARPYLDFIARANTLGSLDPARIQWDGSARLIHDPVEKVVSRNPENWIMVQLSAVMQQARQQLQITSPYFIPGTAGTRQLVEMVASGVEVSILTNSLAANDVAAVHGGYARYRLPLLQGGVRLFELQRMGKRPKLSFRASSGASLHTKAFTLDDHRAFIGSVNFDPRSASLNTEMGILFEAPALISEMQRIYRMETAPEMSYRLDLDPRGRIRWQEAGASHKRDPDAPLARRLLARVVGWLPLESQL